MKIGKLKPWLELVREFDIDQNGCLCGSDHISYEVWKRLKDETLVLDNSSKVKRSVSGNDRVTYTVGDPYLDILYDDDNLDETGWVAVHKQIYDTYNSALGGKIVEFTRRGWRADCSDSVKMQRAMRGLIQELDMLAAPSEILNVIVTRFNPTNFRTIAAEWMGINRVIFYVYSEKEKILSEREMELVTSETDEAGNVIYRSKECGDTIIQIVTILELIQNFLDILEKLAEEIGTEVVKEYIDIIKYHPEKRKGFIRDFISAKEKEKNEAEYDAFKGNLSRIIGTRLKECKQHEVDLTKDKIRDAEAALFAMFDTLRRLEMELYCSQRNNDETVEEMLTVMKGAGILHPTMIDSDTIKFRVVTDLVNFEENDWKLCRDNYVDDFMATRVAKVFDKLVSREWTLVMEQVCTLPLDTGEVRCLGEREGDYRNNEYGIPNPHHYFYQCWQENKVLINQAIMSGNYIAAIMQIISAVGGVNIAEGMTVHRMAGMMNDTEYWDIPCIKTPEGRITLDEAYDRLEDE